MPALLRRAASLALLLALAAVLPRGARADDPPPDSASPRTYDPADKNQDGTVTRRESRQYRRARRMKGTGGDDDAGSPDAGAAQSDAGAARNSAAMGKASAAADAFSRAMAPADAGVMPAGGAAPAGKTGIASAPGAAAAGAAGAAGAAAGGFAVGSTGASGGPHDLSNPRTVADFALAARSGYAPAFAAAGLKLSKDGRSIVRLDGSPATAADLAMLRSGILALPAALARRPDFFAHVSQEHYADLKKEYRERPELAGSVYKDVGTTEKDRDFIHTESCSKVSGECNKAAADSYKKGDLVSPEDLDRMWEALQKDLDADAEGRAPHDETAAKTDGGAAAAASDPSDPSSPEAAAKKEGKSSGGAVSVVAGAPAAAVAAVTVAAKKAWSKAREILGPSNAEAAKRAALPLGGLAAAGVIAAAFVLARRRA